MKRWTGGATRFPTGPIYAASLLLTALLFCVPWAHAATDPAAPGDVPERGARARALLDTPQGAALLDLLGDPAVRARLLTAPPTPAPLPSMSPPPAAMKG